MKTKKTIFQTSVVMSTAGITLLAVMLSGCAGQRSRITRPVIQYTTISFNPGDVREIRYIRRHVQTQAAEVMTITHEQAVIERVGRRAFKPKVMQLEEGTFTALAERAVSFSWNVSPKRVLNPVLQEEMVIKTQEKEEKVLF